MEYVLEEPSRKEGQRLYDVKSERGLIPPPVLGPTIRLGHFKDCRHFGHRSLDPIASYASCPHVPRECVEIRDPTHGLVFHCFMLQDFGICYMRESTSLEGGETARHNDVAPGLVNICDAMAIANSVSEFIGPAGHDRTYLLTPQMR